MLEVLDAASSTDLTTIPALVAEVGTMTPAQQDWIGLAIEAASALIEQEANQFFAQQNYRETIPGSGSSTLMLDRTPILGTPTIITTDNEVIVDFVVEDPVAGILYRRQGWTQEISYQRSITYDPLGYETHPTFVVTYDAGYHLPSFTDEIDTDAGQIGLPANVEKACILSIKAWWHKKNRDSTVSWKQVGDLALGYRGPSAAKGADTLRLPPEAKALIKPRIF
jgi:hypothetical protein